MPASTSHRCDVFISHASEDKDSFVRPLAAELTRLGLIVWYDELTLRLGDSLRQKIDEGLSSSRYGVVILSSSFFSKQWPRAELDALYAREMEGQKVILPIWHHITKEEVIKHSPLLAAKLAMPTDQGVAAVAREIFSTVRPDAAPPVNPSAQRISLKNGKTQSEPLTELLRTVNDVAPLLHKLDEQLEDKEARLFLGAMQRFFNGTNLLTAGIDSNLSYGADNLLRVLSSEDGIHPNYLIGKIAAAQSCFEDFRKRMKIGHPLPDVERKDSVYLEIQHLHATMLSMLDDSSILAKADRLVLRLVVALLAYGRSQHTPKRRFPPIAPNVHHTLREYLSLAFCDQLNVSLPDTLDNIWTGDMKAYCHSAWETIEREER